MNITIGQVAKQKQLSISQLRYYDAQGLLPFLKRTDKGDRLFDEDALRFLDLILCLKDTGMPIKEIKQFVDWSMNQENPQTPQRLAMMQQHEEKVRQQIKETEQHLVRIKEKIVRLESELH